MFLSHNIVSLSFFINNSKETLVSARISFALLFSLSYKITVIEVLLPRFILLTKYEIFIL